MCYLSPASPIPAGAGSSAGCWTATRLLPKSQLTILRTYPDTISGDEGTRPPDLLRAREALSQLSYIPEAGCPQTVEWA